MKTATERHDDALAEGARDRGWGRVERIETETDRARVRTRFAATSLADLIGRRARMRVDRARAEEVEMHLEHWLEGDAVAA